MLLADAPLVTPPLTSVVSTLDGVTTVLVLFMFICLVMPSLVKNRTQYYAGLAAVLFIVVLHTLMLAFDTSPTIINFSSVFIGIFQVGALLLFVLCVGGLTAKQLAGDMARAYEVVRRGETEKEVIIPIGDQPRRGAKPAETSQKVYKVDTSADTDDDMQIPLS